MEVLKDFFIDEGPSGRKCQKRLGVKHEVESEGRNPMTRAQNKKTLQIN